MTSEVNASVQSSKCEKYQSGKPARSLSSILTKNVSSDYFKKV